MSLIFMNPVEQETFFGMAKGPINIIKIKELQIKTMRYIFIQKSGRKFLKLVIPSVGESVGKQKVEGTYILGTSNFTFK